MAKKVLKELEKLNKEKVKNVIDLESEKEKFIKEITQIKKEDIIPKPPKKLSLWNRIKKVLMGL
jgi:hypothetical protein